jgi:prepilin-type N-terminal cleavage/methylation domain-containing protein
MSCRPSTRASRRAEPDRGYTLVELLVSMLLSAVVMSVAARDFGFSVRARQDLDLLVETQQGLRAAVGAITQELRQAGACLPTTGDFVALDGEDDGTNDRLTVRIGRVRSDNLVCIRTLVTADAVAGTSILTVEDSSGFTSGEWIYVRGTSGSGKSYRVLSVTASTLVVAGALDADYLAGSGVFAIEERTYTIDASGSVPILTVAIDGQEAQPLVHGVEKLDVLYLLTPCPPCDPIDEPNVDEWHQVREIQVSIGVLSSVPNRSGEYVRMESTTNVKPRNLI